MACKQHNKAPTGANGCTVCMHSANDCASLANCFQKATTTYNCGCTSNAVRESSTDCNKTSTIAHLQDRSGGLALRGGQQREQNAFEHVGVQHGPVPAVTCPILWCCIGAWNHPHCCCDRGCVEKANRTAWPRCLGATVAPRLSRRSSLGVKKHLNSTHCGWPLLRQLSVFLGWQLTTLPAVTEWRSSRFPSCYTVWVHLGVIRCVSGCLL